MSSEFRRPVSAEMCLELRLPVSAETNLEFLLPVFAEMSSEFRLPVSAGMSSELRRLVSAVKNSEFRLPVSADFPFHSVDEVHTAAVLNYSYCSAVSDHWKLVLYLLFSAFLLFLEQKYAHPVCFPVSVYDKEHSEQVSAVAEAYPVPDAAYAALSMQSSDCFDLVFVPNSAGNADSDYWCFGVVPAVLLQVLLLDLRSDEPRP